MCSKSCDKGLQYRYRVSLREPCMDKNSQIQLCEIRPCLGNNDIVYIVLSSFVFYVSDKHNYLKFIGNVSFSNLPQRNII